MVSDVYLHPYIALPAPEDENVPEAVLDSLRQHNNTPQSDCNKLDTLCSAALDAIEE